jgi:hypothetical protein
MKEGLLENTNLINLNIFGKIILIIIIIIIR